MPRRKPKPNERSTAKVAEAYQMIPGTPDRRDDKRSEDPGDGIGRKNEAEDVLGGSIQPTDNGNSKKTGNKNPKLKVDEVDAKSKVQWERNVIGPPDKPKSSSKFTSMTCVLVPVFIAVIVTVVALFVAPKKSSHFKANFQSNMDKLFKDFKNQPARTARKLRSRIVPYLNHTTSPQPFVLLVAAVQEDRLAAHCFAGKVGQLILPNTQPVVIDGSSYSGVESKEAKKDIDQQLRKAFQKGEFPTAVIVHNLESIPYSTSALFYSYCDHDNPLYKEAAIIFTVLLPESYNSLASLSDDIKKEEMVETYLSRDSQWARDANFDENVMGALLSRITDTVIVLNSENNETLETCQ